MTASIIPLKRCSRGDDCVHPDGPELPATAKYFNKDRTRNDGLHWYCKACTAVLRAERKLRDGEKIRAQGRASYLRNRESILQKTKEKNRANPEPNRQRVKKWLKENAEYASEQRRKKYWSNPERYRQESRAWRVAHPEQAKRRSREHYELNKPKYQQYRRRYYIQNKAVSAERNALWRKQHKSAVKAIQMNYRARRRAAPGTITKRNIEIILRTQKFRCWYCGCDLKASGHHIDHRIPLSRGGSNEPGNLVAACPHCNTSKRDRLPHEWSNRLL